MLKRVVLEVVLSDHFDDALVSDVFVVALDNCGNIGGLHLGFG
jgi:hypothetical protein